MQRLTLGDSEVSLSKYALSGRAHFEALDEGALGSQVHLSWIQSWLCSSVAHHSRCCRELFLSIDFDFVIKLFANFVAKCSSGHFYFAVVEIFSAVTLVFLDVVHFFPQLYADYRAMKPVKCVLYCFKVVLS